jgi:hypothetical protein
VKRGVGNRDGRDPRQAPGDRSDYSERWRIMQRSELRGAFDGRHNVVGRQGRRRYPRAAMDYAVSDSVESCGERFTARVRFATGCFEPVKNGSGRAGMVADHKRLSAPASPVRHQEPALGANLLDFAAHQRSPPLADSIDFEEFEFKRRAAAIENQYLHARGPLTLSVS